jgi:hypothetical protein
LGWKSGITKELAKLIFFCSKKGGMGPSAVGGLIETFHWLHWQNCGILWIQYLLPHIKSPLLTDSQDELKALQENVSWFPKYTSDEVCGGIVPSANTV